MAQTYRIDGVEKALSDAIADYRKGAAEACKTAVTRTMEETAQVIKDSVTFRSRTGGYVKSFAVKVAFEDEQNKKIRWYAKAPHYRLTHLLENGHEIRDRNGAAHGRAKSFPHISKGADYADKRLPELIIKGLDDL